MDRKIFGDVDLVEKKQANLSYPTNPSKPTDVNENLHRSLNEIIINDRLFRNTYTERVF
jgi:hypothetical protein